MQLVIWFLLCRFPSVMWDYICLWDSDREVGFILLHLEIFLCMDFLLFQINLQLSFYKILFVREDQIVVILKMEVLRVFWVIFILNPFCVVLLLMCSFQCVLLVHSNFTNVLVCLCSNFLFSVCLLLMIVMWFLNLWNITDRLFGDFCLLSLLNDEVRVLRLFLILRMRFLDLRIFS